MNKVICDNCKKEFKISIKKQKIKDDIELKKEINKFKEKIGVDMNKIRKKVEN